MVQKSCILEGFGYHGNLLVFFGFWFLVFRVSNFVRRYSRSGLECPSCMVTPQVLPPQAEGAVLAHAAQTTPVHMVSSAMTQTLMGGASSSSSVSQHTVSCKIVDQNRAREVVSFPPKRMRIPN